MSELGLGTSRALRDVKEEECSSFKCEKIFLHKAAEPSQEWKFMGSGRREVGCRWLRDSALRMAQS